jgi:histidinol-phosphatase (PHP family)
MRPQNLHTHTTFCDGVSTAEEMVRAAIAAGCPSLGFSGHAPLPFPNDWAMADPAPYREEILRLRQAYAGQIELFLGLEQDLLSPPPDAAYDYQIGSVHGLIQNGTLCYVDESADAFAAAIARCFGGDALAFAEAYYAQVARLPAVTGCQIIGHLDLITKFNEGGRFFSEDDPRYRQAALEAVDALLQADVLFEINTGAMARGYRTQPYPAPFLLRAIRAGGGRILLSSDSHSADTLLFGFPQAAALAAACGFTRCSYLTKDGFREEPLPDECL